jgi:hypothetical protein
MRINAPLDTSQPGTPHSFKGASVVADSLRGNHNAMVKCLFVNSRVQHPVARVSIGFTNVYYHRKQLLSLSLFWLHNMFRPI